nr:unnamed protein product [Spirometra erinaceieuropaei]
MRKVVGENLLDNAVTLLMSATGNLASRQCHRHRLSIARTRGRAIISRERRGTRRDPGEHEYVEPQENADDFRNQVLDNSFRKQLTSYLTCLGGHNVDDFVKQMFKQDVQ